MNIYEATIGDNTKIGTFVEIQKDVRIGINCKISSHSFLCTGVVIEDDVFIGHGVMFTNDRFPRSVREDGHMKTEADYVTEKTTVKRGAAIGSNVTILPGITIGEYALIGAGSVVTKDVPPKSVVIGNPAKVMEK